MKRYNTNLPDSSSISHTILNANQNIKQYFPVIPKIFVMLENCDFDPEKAFFCPITLKVHQKKRRRKSKALVL